MKKNKLKISNSYLKNRHESELKRKERRKRKRLKMKSNKISTSKFFQSALDVKDINLNVPSNFELKNNLEVVLSFVAKFKSYAAVANEIGSIDLNLKAVEEIDLGAISLLLSSIKELSLKGIHVYGNLPANIKSNEKIIASGFLHHLNLMSKAIEQNKRSLLSNSKDSMLMNGSNKTNHRSIGEHIKKGMSKLCGKERHYQPLYGVIQEMNINSLEHAYKKNKHWIFAINYDSIDNKLVFTFTDNGFGLYQRLSKKFGLKVFEKLQLIGEQEIVLGMFEEQYNSRFKDQYNRNKGLPAIKSLQDKNKVSNLIVISNGTYCNFDTKEIIKVKSPFSGTFYYWELNNQTLNNTK